MITSYYRPNLRAKTAGAKCAYSRVTMVLERGTSFLRHLRFLVPALGLCLMWRTPQSADSLPAQLWITLVGLLPGNADTLGENGLGLWRSW